MTDNPLREVIARALDGTYPFLPVGAADNECALRLADAAIAAIEASGNCIVPLEPTHAMSIKGDDEMCDTIVNAADVYRAMLSVRPRDAASTDKEE